MGRMVRCVRCKHQWHEKPPAGSQPVQQPPLPPRPMDYKPQLPAVRKSARPDSWYLPATVALLTLVVGGVWLFKDYMQQTLPLLETALNPLESAQEIQTLKVSDNAASVGLVIDKLSRQIEEQDGFVTYVVRGSITNTNLAEKRVPNLRVALLDRSGVQLDAWRVQPERRLLEAGATTQWVCLFYDPPLENIHEFSISFVTE